MSELAQLAQELESYIRPDTFPMGVAIWPAGELLPPKIKRPLSDLGHRISACQAFGFVRRYGWSLGLGMEDHACPIPVIAFGHVAPPGYYSEGNLAHGMYCETLEAGRRAEEVVNKLSPEEAGTLLIAPLARATFTPETVVLYGNSAQVMRLAIASLYKRGGALESHVVPRADCTELTIRVRQMGKPLVVLPCYGDRLFGQTQDHEMAFAFPYSFAAHLLEGLKGTQAGGIRYPIPSYLRYEPGFPSTYSKLAAMWEKNSSED